MNRVPFDPRQNKPSIVTFKQFSENNRCTDNQSYYTENYNSKLYRQPLQLYNGQQVQYMQPRQPQQYLYTQQPYEQKSIKVYRSPQNLSPKLSKQPNSQQENIYLSPFKKKSVDNNKYAFKNFIGRENSKGIVEPVSSERNGRQKGRLFGALVDRINSDKKQNSLRQNIPKVKNNFQHFKEEQQQKNKQASSINSFNSILKNIKHSKQQCDPTFSKIDVKTIKQPSKATTPQKETKDTQNTQQISPIAKIRRKISEYGKQGPVIKRFSIMPNNLIKCPTFLPGKQIDNESKQKVLSNKKGTAINTPCTITNPGAIASPDKRSGPKKPVQNVISMLNSMNHCGPDDNLVRVSLDKQQRQMNDSLLSVKAKLY